MNRMCKYSCRQCFECTERIWHFKHVPGHIYTHRARVGTGRKRRKKRTSQSIHPRPKRKMNECASLNISVNLKTNYGSMTQSQCLSALTPVRLHNFSCCRFTSANLWIAKLSFVLTIFSWFFFSFPFVSSVSFLFPCHCIEKFAHFLSDHLFKYS